MKKPKPTPPVVVLPPFLNDFEDLNRGRCIVAVSSKPGVWDWCGPLDGVRQVHDRLAKLGIRTAQMKLPNGHYALIGWWTPAPPKQRRRV